MINLAFRLFLTLNATSLLLIVFLVQKGYSLAFLFNQSSWMAKIPDFASYIIYAIVPLTLTGISIWLSKFLGKDEFKKGEVKTIEYASNSFLPSYLGYFFVALSISNWDTLIFVYIMLFIFTFFSQALYFNPLFLVFGYEFYNIKTKHGTAIFLISQHHYKQPSDIEIATVYRINNYTFIEKG